MASYDHYSQHADRIRLDHIRLIRLPTSKFQFSSIFPKKARNILCKTDPDPDLIWMAWSGIGPRHLVQKQAGVQESLGPVSCRMPPACYQFPIFRLSCILPQYRRPRSYCVKPAQMQLGSGRLCQVLVKRIRSGSKPVCKNHRAHFWPMLPSHSGSGADQIQHIYWEYRTKKKFIISLADHGGRMRFVTADSIHRNVKNRWLPC